MKTTILFLIAFLISLSLISQNEANYLTIESGDIKDAKGIMKSVKHAFILPNGKIDMVVGTIGNVFLTQIDPKNNEEKSVEIDLPFNGDEFYYLRTSPSGSQLCAFFVTFDFTNLKKSLWGVRFDGETLEQISKPTVLIKSEIFEPKKVQYGLHKENPFTDEMSGYFITRGINTNNFLVVEFLDENGVFNINSYILDEDMEELAYYNSTSSNKIYPVLDGNNVSFINSSQLPDNYSVDIVYSEITDLNEMILFESDLTFLSCRLVSNDNGIFSAGFYSDNNSKVEGVYSASMDLNSGNTKELFLFDFDSMNSAKTLITSSRKKNDKIARKFFTSSIINMPDGGFSMVGQVVYEQDELVTQGRIDYYYSDFYVMRSNAAGKIMWVRKLPRYLHADIYQMYAGHLAFEYNGDVCIVYNDDERNLTSANDSVYETSLRSKYSITTIARISPDGLVSRNVLFRYKDMGSVANPSQSMVCGSGEFLMLHRKAVKDVKYSVVKLNE